MSFSVPEQVSEALRSLVALPVDLREEDATLVARTTLGALAAGRTEVPEGAYYASVQLPNGTRLTQRLPTGTDGRPDLNALTEQVQARVAAAATAAVSSATTTSPASMASVLSGAVLAAAQAFGALRFIVQPDSDTRLSLQRRFGPLAMGLGAPPSPAAPTLGGWKVEGWRGTALGRALAPLGPGPLHAAAEGDSLRVQPNKDDRPSTVRLTPPEGEPLNLVLPPGAAAVVPRAGVMQVDVGEPAMNAVLQLRAAGRVTDFGGAAPVDADFVRGCLDRPGAALAAAYLVLRTSKRDDPMSALDALAPLDGLADTAVLWAERAARGGRHGEALTLFLQACRLDLPAFSAGLGYLVDRLRLYARTQADLPPDAPEQARAALAAVQPVALQCDFTAPLVSYHGPVEPGVAVPEATPAEQLPEGKEHPG